jgi:hypothetical protein
LVIVDLLPAESICSILPFMRSVTTKLVANPAQAGTPPRAVVSMQRSRYWTDKPPHKVRFNLDDHK